MPSETRFVPYLFSLSQFLRDIEKGNLDPGHSIYLSFKRG